MIPAIDQQRAIDTFFDLVRIDSPSGQEEAIGQRLERLLRECGVEAGRDAGGNVIGRRPGRGRLAGLPPLLLAAHMDTVQPGTGIRPVIDGGVIRSSGETILAADDKAGITAILEALRRAEELGLETRPLEIVFTVQEETGLRGAKALDVAALAARQAVVLDSHGPVGTIVHRAPAQNAIEVVVIGRAAHAGVAPEQGISALVAAARALAAMRLGRIDDETTANFGVISGGTASNVVPERVYLKGEARSRDEGKLEAQTRHMLERLEAAAQELGARVEAKVERAYSAFSIPDDAPVIRLAGAAMRACGLEPQLVPTGGGSDANVLNAAGIQAVNLGVGYEKPHSVDECITVESLARICQVVLALVTAAA
jgi:tripeptide aminopeptidase